MCYFIIFCFQYDKVNKLTADAKFGTYVFISTGDVLKVMPFCHLLYTTACNKQVISTWDT